MTDVRQFAVAAGDATATSVSIPAADLLGTGLAGRLVRISARVTPEKWTPYIALELVP